MSVRREDYHSLTLAKADYPFIPLTQGYNALVDPEDFERFGTLNWCALIDKRTGHVYAARDSKTTLLHRLIMNAPKGVYVDHINRNTLDCRRTNLRLATHQQNMFNRRRAKAGKHGFVGVEGSPDRGYRGYVGINGHRHLTRTFHCPILAAAARDVLAREHHGEFAVLNFRFIPLEAA